MSHARTLAVSLTGLDGVLVDVEADVSPGLPAFSLGGLPDSSMLQARDRVRAASAQCGHHLPQRRITVNLQPAFIPKHGSGFDLAIAVAVAAAQQSIRQEGPARTVHIGELGLDGRLRPVPGILPALLTAREQGAERAVVPLQNLAEAKLVEGLEVEGAASLAEVLRGWGGQVGPEREEPAFDGAEQTGTSAPPAPEAELDFRDVLGQAQARRAIETAAAGGHHLLMVGPPGSGKTMIASRLPTILPPLDGKDALDVSAVRSLDGLFDARSGLIRRAPFESPHHTSTVAAMVGGGSGLARPGAISRAHAGVLFLDEAPEFSRDVLDALREPLETGDITLHRSRGAVRYPARFQLILAANPCPCGRAEGRGRLCTCSPLQRRRYLGRLSGPVQDRIDMRVSVPTAAPHELDAQAESSATIAARVLAARFRQRQRFEGRPWRTNSEIPGSALRRELSPAPRDRAVLEQALADGRLTLRGHDRVLRLAWTLCDLDGAAVPDAEHIGRALALRGGEIG